MYYCWLGEVGLDTGEDLKDFDWATFDPSTQGDEFKEPEMEAVYDWNTYVDGDRTTYPPFNPKDFDLYMWLPEYTNPDTFPADFVEANYDKNDSDTWPVSVEFYAFNYANQYYSESPMDDLQKEPYLPEKFTAEIDWDPANYSPPTFPKTFDPMSYDYTDESTWPNPVVEKWNFMNWVDGDTSTY